MLESFIESLKGRDLPAFLRAGLIGEGAPLEGPFGTRPLLYADYVASGRALRQVEDFVLDKVLPYYANSHTEASYCGAFCTRLREEARRSIAAIVGAGAGTSVVFAGSGATAGINKIVRLLDIPGAVARGEKVVVFIGPYEHHSNILPWRESGAELVDIPESETGGPDLAALEAALQASGEAVLRVGAFSAASNVTGILADIDAVTRLLKRHGALAVWDYAGGAPYLPMSMADGSDAAKDAIVFSPHKFPGGPGATGILVIRESIIRISSPTAPGGGSVTFVSPWGHAYAGSLSVREEAGTPNVVGDIRAALVLLIKQALGQGFIERRDVELRERALAAWRGNPRIELLGRLDVPRLPIFSFRVRDGAGGYIHHQLFTRLLSDLWGIQARGGCACAGPYAHRLLDIDRDISEAIFAAIRAGREVDRPGWVRLNFSYLMSDDSADRVIAAVDELARRAGDHVTDYVFDPRTARFRHKEELQRLEG
ncbi:MAG: aminotransferase class V-fold PLP-dependent enzyme [Kiloniellaceae bacterium]